MEKLTTTEKNEAGETGQEGQLLLWSLLCAGSYLGDSCSPCGRGSGSQGIRSFPSCICDLLGNSGYIPFHILCPNFPTVKKNKRKKKDKEKEK